MKGELDDIEKVDVFKRSILPFFFGAFFVGSAVGVMIAGNEIPGTSSSG